MGHYYHLFANGDDAKGFIISVQDFTAAFNRFALCAAMYPDVEVLAFSIEDTHPHCLAYGDYDRCISFKKSYELLTTRYIVSNRGSLDDVIFELEMLEIDNEDYLLNVAAYVIIQPTKDGKQIMPYDYYWGTGSMYFRSKNIPPLWRFDDDGNICSTTTFGMMSVREKHRLLRSKLYVPSDWIVCNGIILPSNYLAIARYESIFKTYNRFRTFMSSGRKQLQKVEDGMALARGIVLNDMDARSLSQDVSIKLFGKKDSRWLTPEQRLRLSRELRYTYRMSIRQISSLCRLPESEIRKYIR